MARVVAFFRHFKRTRSALLLLLLALVSCWEVEADLVVSTTDINFGTTKESTVITVRNDSEDNALTSGVITLEYQLKPDRPWLKVSPLSGRCGEAEKISHTVTVDRSLMVYGENLATIAVTSNGGRETIRVKAIRSVPGCSDPPLVATDPSPASGSTQVSTTPELSWENGDSRCEQLTATYDVYFGSTTPPPFHHNNDSLKVWNPGALATNTQYYWRVVAKDANGTTNGPVWSFHTLCDLGPTAVTLSSPANNATDVNVNDNLSWGGGNSQCPGLTRTYDVYFGTISPPPFVNNTSLQTWDPGTLANGTTYFWRVVAKDANGSVSSSERSFTTKQLVCTTKATAVTLVSPSNNATDVPITQDLVWTGGDSQCPGLTATYDVYFGTVSPPPLSHNNGSEKSWDAPLEYSTIYYWRVVAKDANGSVSSSERMFRTPCRLTPTTPTLIYPADGATGVSINDNLSWNNGNSQCTGLTATYDVYFGVTTPPPFAGSSGTSKAFEPGLMLPSTRYYWRVVAKDENGSTSSAERTFTTGILPCTAGPGSVSLVSPSDGATNRSLDTDLTWSGGNSQCEGQIATYDVYFGTSSPPPLHHNNGQTKTWDPGALAPTTKYYWRIVAKDGNGSVSSSERDFTTGEAPCTAGPGTVTIGSPSNGADDVSVDSNLSWGGGNSQCAGLTATYDVYFGTTNPPPFDHNNGTAKNWDPGTLANGTTYYWKIVAADDNGTSTGPVWSFSTVAAPCELPPTAATVSSPANGAGGVSIDADVVWTGGNSQCAGLTATYDVYFGTTNPPAFDHNNGTTKSWNPGTLENGTTYYWKVVAKDANGTAPATVWSFTTVACELPPTAATVSSPANGAGGVSIDADLVWTGGSSQCPGLTATYNVHFGTSNPPPFDHNNGTAKSWNPGTLANATTYYWRIVTIDDNGSASGPVWSFTTVAAACELPPNVATLSSPANGSTSVSINGNLVWSGGNSQCEGLTATYDVYFGTTDPPPFDHNNGSIKSFDPGTLTYSTTYYWRIVSRDANGQTEGPVWSFTTEAQCLSAPTVPCTPNPQNGATNRNENSNLAWQCGDSQCGLPVTYDVYMGTTETLGEEHKLGSTSEKSWDLDRLNKSQKYYWRIVARDANGATAGPVWNFTTRN